jgi:hypothetical protein
MKRKLLLALGMALLLSSLITALPVVRTAGHAPSSRAAAVEPQVPVPVNALGGVALAAVLGGSLLAVQRRTPAHGGGHRRACRR